MAQHQPLAQHKMSRAKNSGKHGSGALVTRVWQLRPDQWNLAGLLCYGPVSRTHEPRDVAEEAMSATVKFEKDGYKDEPRSVKDGARGTEEHALTSSENKFTFETHCGTDEYFHASINAEMLTTAVRTHADCAERWCQFVQV